MKTVKNLILGIVLVATSFVANAQKNIVKTVALEQTKGEFTQQSITLSPGDYVFEIANNGIDHEVGFVLAPKGKTDQAHHIKNAYVTSTVKKDSKSKSKVVRLEKGEYTYFCPLNPTPQYRLIVK
jgi:plastocyanin